MFLYHLKLVVVEKKLDEFIEMMRHLSSGIRKDKDALMLACTGILKKMTLIAYPENGRRARPWKLILSEKNFQC